ncbi:MAG: hypothetical protein WC718_04105 [Phycisphaerales bacterium]|jgi:hypothetical protein
MTTPTQPIPLSSPGRAANHREEFAFALHLILKAQELFVNRPEPYRRTLGDKLMSLGLSLGISTSRACFVLAERDPLCCCVCARPYLEFALRLLWASREPDGMDRVFATYAADHQANVGKLATVRPEFKELVEATQSAAPLASLTQKRAPDLRATIEQIGRRDSADGVSTLYADAEEYDLSIGYLHNFSHANPLTLSLEPGDALPTGANAVVNATLALLRTIGYRLHWEQESIVHIAIGISSFEPLTDLEKDSIRTESVQSGGTA